MCSSPGAIDLMNATRPVPTDRPAPAAGKPSPPAPSPIRPSFARSLLRPFASPTIISGPSFRRFYTFFTYSSSLPFVQKPMHSIPPFRPAAPLRGESPPFIFIPRAVRALRHSWFLPSSQPVDVTFLTFAFMRKYLKNRLSSVLCDILFIFPNAHHAEGAI